MVYLYPQEVYIIGAGGFGRELATWADSAGDSNTGAGRFTVKGFIDNNYKSLPKVINEVPVCGDDDYLLDLASKSSHSIGVMIGIGHPQIKRKIHEKLKKHGNIYFPNLLSVNTVVGPEVNMTVDSGIIITPGNIITCNIDIKPHVMINLSCTVGHDCTIGEYATLSPGVNLSGNVKVGEGAYLGTGSSLVEGITVGEWSVLGGQAFAAKDIPPNSTCVGVPAKPIKTRQAGWHL